MNATEAAVLYECEEGIATITLNRPEKLNAFNAAMFAGLNEAMARFRDDEGAQVAIVTAAGDKAFSAGMDLEEGLRLVTEGGDTREEDYEFDFINDDLGGKPVIFAGFGHCVGQAVALACCADIRIVAEGTIFSMPEARIGVSAVVLPVMMNELIGASQAAYSLLYGGELTTEWAMRSGFAHEVTAPGDLMKRARRIARSMMEQGPLALRAHKVLLRTYRREGAGKAIEKGMEFRQTTLNSSDFREGLTAFREKRPPRFKAS